MKENNLLKDKIKDLKSENIALKKENELLKKQQKIMPENKITDNANDLKNKFQNLEKLNEEYKPKISELKNQININYTTISLLQKQLEQKEELLKKVDLNKSQKIIDGEIMSINFTNVDKAINYSIACISTDIFATVEEKLYKEFPEFRETNNYFLSNGNTILRFKTVAENKIKNGYPIILILPGKDK